MVPRALVKHARIEVFEVAIAGDIIEQRLARRAGQIALEDYVVESCALAIGCNGRDKHSPAIFTCLEATLDGHLALGNGVGLGSKTLSHHKWSSCVAVIVDTYRPWDVLCALLKAVGSTLNAHLVV